MDKINVLRTGRSFAEPAEFCKNNARLKLYPNVNGEYFPIEEMVCTSHVFNPLGVEYAYGKTPKVFSEYGGYEISEEQKQLNNKERAVRRAKARLYELIRCNCDMNFFVTLTFSEDKVKDRTNYNDVIRIVNQWLNNRVKRNGLKYVGVAERHKMGGIHFHFVVNDMLKNIDSGTVKCLGRKKPIKIATADKYKISVDERKTVYNVADWHYGFSTSIAITGDDSHIKTAHYLVKYLSKNTDKIGGRYYFSGGHLLRPKYEYYNKDFNSIQSDYEFEVAGIKYKVRKFE